MDSTFFNTSDMTMSLQQFDQMVVNSTTQLKASFNLSIASINASFASMFTVFNTMAFNSSTNWQTNVGNTVVLLDAYFLTLATNMISYFANASTTLIAEATLCFALLQTIGSTQFKFLEANIATSVSASTIAILSALELMCGRVVVACQLIGTSFLICFSTIGVNFGIALAGLLSALNITLGAMDVVAAISATAISGSFVSAFAIISAAAIIMGSVISVVFGALAIAVAPVANCIGELNGGFVSALDILSSLTGIVSGVIGIVTALGGAGTIAGTGMLYAGAGFLAAGIGMLFMATAAILAAKALYLVTKLSGGNTHGVSSKDFGINVNINQPNIQTCASGGFPSMGQMFIAREAGPELVGTIGSRTAVANNYQIEEGIARAVTRAMSQASLGGNWIIQLVDEGGIKSETIISAAERRNRRDGRTIIPLGV